jgi:hypothetical protein
MKIKQLAELHNKICHSRAEVTEKEIELEEKWVMKYPYDVLDAVCSDCFGPP